MLSGSGPTARTTSPLGLEGTAAAGAASLDASPSFGATPARGGRDWSCFRSTDFTRSPSMYFAQSSAATRPKTTQSRSELPPRRLLPCTPPATSPAAYKPGMTFLPVL